MPHFIAGYSATEDVWTRALVVIFRQGIQLLTVAALIGLFFVAFGSLTMGTSTIASWIGTAPDIVTSAEVGSVELVLTAELVKVAVFLASFAGLYFAVYAVHDPGFRAEFFEEVAGDVRTALAVRHVYLAAGQQGA